MKKISFKKNAAIIALAGVMLLSMTACKGDDAGKATGTGESTKESTGVTITTATDLANYKVGCQTGTTGEGWYKKEFSKDATGFKSGMDAALALKNGQIDAIVIDELPAKSIVSKNDDLEILDIQFAKEEYAIAIAKDNAQLLETINATIKRMKDDGTYQALNDAFVPADGVIKIPEDLTPEAGGGTLRMGTNAAFPPFEYVEGDKIVGFDISMCQNIAKDARCELEVKNMEFESLIAALQSGNIDMIAAGMSVTEERKKNVDFSDPYYESEQVIIVLK